MALLATCRSWKLCGLTLLPWCYLLFLFQPWNLWVQQSTDPAPNALPARLTVMSWNVLCVNEDVAEIQRVIEEHPVDLLVLLEFRPNLFEQVPALERMYRRKLAYPSWGGNGIAVLTNRDDIELSRVDLGGSILPSIAASLPDKRLTVIGMHTWSPFPPGRATARDLQLAELVSWSTAQASPICVVGDLNITPWAPAFSELMRAGLKDSRNSGFGNSASWPAWAGPLGIPIDHALSCGPCQIVKRELGPMVHGSDHRPVLIEIAY